MSIVLERARQQADFLDLIKRVYGDSNGFKSRSLSFKSEPITDFETFSQALRLIGGYNNFDPEKVVSKMALIWKKIMYVEIGRESSPVIYIHLPFWTNQQIGRAESPEFSAQATRLLDEQKKAIKEDVLLVVGGLDADEIDEQDTYKMTVRVWWD